MNFDKPADIKSATLGEMFHSILDDIEDIVGLVNAETLERVAVNRYLRELLGYSQKEFAKLPLEKIDLNWNREERIDQLRELKNRERNTFERTFQTKGGETLDILFIEKLVQVDGKEYILQTGRNVTALRNTQRELKAARDEMEQKVKERTAELEEANSALQALLEKHDREKEEMEENLIINIKDLVEPYLKKLKRSKISSRQEVYIRIISENIQNLIEPLLHRAVKEEFSVFTPKEISVANLIKQGKTTKEIANVLNSSLDTIEWHRKNLRKKLHIVNKKINLRSYLMTHLK